MVHSVTKAAITPTAARGRARAAPTTPTVRGKTIKVLPDLSRIEMRLTLPCLMSSLTFLIKSLPVTLMVSAVGFFVFVFVVIINGNTNNYFRGKTWAV